MRRSERVARIYISAVMFAETFVLISFRDDLDTWTWVAMMVGAAVLLLPFAARNPTRFLRGLSSALAALLSLAWAVVAWPTGSVAWLAWALVIWFATLPGPDGDTPQERERLETHR